jgi:hypothetical protein
MGIRGMSRASKSPNVVVFLVSPDFPSKKRKTLCRQGGLRLTSAFRRHCPSDIKPKPKPKTVGASVKLWK